MLGLRAGSRRSPGTAGKQAREAARRHLVQAALNYAGCVWADDDNAFDAEAKLAAARLDMAAKNLTDANRAGRGRS